MKHVDTCPTCQRDHSRAERKWYECPVCRAELCDECIFDGLTTRCEDCGRIFCREHRIATDDPDVWVCGCEQRKKESECQALKLAS